MSLSIALSMPARAESDTQAPQLLSLSVGPPVDVSAGPGVVVVSARLADDLSGVASGTLAVNRPVAGNSPPGGPLTRVSGTALDGVFQWSVSIPRFSAAGTYELALSVVDASGNRLSYLHEALGQAGFPNTLQVTGTSDTQAPQLLSLSFSPPSVDVSGGPATVVASARMTDDLSGVGSAILSVNRSGPGDSPQAGPVTRVSGTALDGVFQWSLPIPQFSVSGSYPVAVIVADASGNRRTYLDDDLAAAGLPNAIQVTANFYATRTALISSRNPSAVGDTVVLTASVSPFTSSSNTPSGSVSFADGATSLGTASLDGGVAQLSIATLGAGSHSISAVYSGDSTFAASTSSPLTQVVLTPTATASPTSGSSGALISVTGDGWNPTGGSVALHFTSGPDVASATVDSAGHLDASISVGDGEALGSNPIVATQDALTASAPFTVVVAASVPAAPVIGSATSGNAAGTVSYTAAADGGSSVTAFTVTCVSSNGGVSGSTSALTNPIVVSGLTNGKSYTCTVTATNTVGTSAPSAASNTFVPATVPTAPRSVVASSRDAGAAVSFAAPVSDGGSAVVAYIVTCASSNGGVTKSAFGAGTPISVSGLTNGNSYTCTVTAANSVGASTPSTASNAFVPATVPTAPRSVVASGRDAGAAVSFAAPVSDGGSGVVAYIATCVSSNGGVSKSAFGAGSPVTVSGLTNGKSYTCTVTAANSVGTGPASPPSPSFVPATVPTAPRSVVASSRNAGALVSFAAPVSDGGSAVVAYIVTCASSNGGVTKSAFGAGSPVTVSGLTNNKSYTCTVTAANSVGSGPASASSPAFVPTAT